MMALVVANLALDGYEIDQAADGGRLIIELVRGARCRQMAVDVIVSDLRMPVCSGLRRRSSGAANAPSRIHAAPRTGATHSGA